MNVSPQHYLFSRIQNPCLKFKGHKLQIQTYIPEINKKWRPSDNLVVNLTPHMPIPTYNTTIFKKEIMTPVSVKEYMSACTIALKLICLTLLTGKEPK